MIVVGEACFLWRQLDERRNATFRLGTREQLDFLKIVHVVIGSACPDRVRGTGVANDGHNFSFSQTNIELNYIGFFLCLTHYLYGQADFIILIELSFILFSKPL